MKILLELLKKLKWFMFTWPHKKITVIDNKTLYYLRERLEEIRIYEENTYQNQVSPTLTWHAICADVVYPIVQKTMNYSKTGFMKKLRIKLSIFMVYLIIQDNWNNSKTINSTTKKTILTFLWNKRENQNSQRNGRAITFFFTIYLIVQKHLNYS